MDAAVNLVSGVVNDAANESKSLLAKQSQVRELAQRDREVRAHEAAHAAVGGAHAGRPVYDTQRGPNGVQYAVGGSVAIDVAPVPGDPFATLEKMRTVRRAALAPANPSSADRAVAARASSAAAEASAELSREPRNNPGGELKAERTAGPPDTRGAFIDKNA